MRMFIVTLIICIALSNCAVAQEEVETTAIAEETDVTSVETSNIEGKIEMYQAQLQEKVTYINQLQQQINKTQQEIFLLQGAIGSLRELLQENPAE